jgi:S1-C subfamily serine protease
MNRRVLALLAPVVVAACNTTPRMDIPPATDAALLPVTQRVERQPSFALDKVVANIKRGTTILHYPSGASEGSQCPYCNYRYSNPATVEWGPGGSSALGNWSTELGEVFYHTLTARGVNVAGNPADLFRQSKSAQSAEYLIGARITEIRGNVCHMHSWWDGSPLNEFYAEIYVDVDWTVFSSVTQREVLTLRTKGYTKPAQGKRGSIVVAFHDAFGSAAENLLASRQFVDVVDGKSAAEAVAAASGPVRYFAAREPSSRPVDKRIGTVLPAVVTVRIGAGHGSGFVISEDGLLLTNHHVVGDSKTVGIIFNNGVEVAGTVLARNESHDVALVQIPLRVPSYLPVRAERPNTLERVYAVGTPLRESLRSTVTTGVVSAIRTDGRTGLSRIQADVAISPGNSGGPLLDENGNVIGIAVAGYSKASSEGLNLFIPIGDALEAVNLKMGRGPS